jgi:hypothetical protein
MAWLASSSEGPCMRCRAPFDAHDSEGKPVACFHLGTFTARLCDEHAEMLMQELEAVFEGALAKKEDPLTPSSGKKAAAK